MFRLLLSAALACLLAFPTMAQDDRLADLDFEEAPIKDEAVPYFALGAGPAITFSFLPVDDINVRTKELGLDEMSGPFTMYGAEVFTAVGIVPNLRTAFSWVSGSSKVSKTITDPLALLPPTERTMEYAVSLKALHADYAFVIARRLIIAPGIGLGWGSQDITTFQSVAQRDWSDYDSISTAPDMYSSIDRSVLYVPARLSIEYAITPFIALRAQAAYNLPVSTGDWKGNHTATIANVPDGISIQAFNAQVGLFVGLFN
ncbi:MAG: hypothetical protein J5I53_00385 [Bradyrhizobiaceae bacterium]|nr:hypothetical protein [Bradyrhizobiaceae bacterium]